MHVIQKDSEAQRKDGYLPGGALDGIFTDICTQLNAPDFIEIPEPGEKPEGKNWKVPGITHLPDTKTESDFAGGMENFHCKPDKEPTVVVEDVEKEIKLMEDIVDFPASKAPVVLEESIGPCHEEEPRLDTLVPIVNRDDDGDVIPPKINLPT